jgi:hypothetical protein
MDSFHGYTDWFLQSRLALLLWVVGFAALGGAISGLLPYTLAKWRNRDGLARAAMTTCIILGVIGGFRLAFPISIIFVVVALVMGHNEPFRPSYMDQPYRGPEVPPQAHIPPRGFAVPPPLPPKR